MKVLFIGAATSNHTIRWCNSLYEKGNEVVLVCRPDQKDDNNRINSNVKKIYLKYSGTLGYYLNVPHLKKIFKNEKPDIVNVHYASGYGTLARLAKVRPLLISCWGSDIYDFPNQSASKKKLLCKNLLFADGIAATSIAMSNEAKRLIDNKKDVYTTPFGVDLNKFKKIDRIENDKKIIGIVKYLEPIYDIPLLINAFSLVKEKEKNVELHIYGDGHLRGELELLVKELNIVDSVKFFGTIPNYEVPAALNTFDVFVNCSKQESFGVAVVEAMACELPVVVTPTEGFKEVVENGISGIVLEDREPQTMANAILKLLNDPKLAKQYGANGKIRVETLYNWDKNVDTMVNIYKELIAKGK